MDFENDEKYKAIDKYVREKLSDERYIHSISVMNRALEFAKLYGANEQDAIYAGLLHDVAKEVPKNQRVLLAEELGIQLDEIEKKEMALIHAKMGAYIAKHTFDLNDDICNAIRTHTSEDRDYEIAKEVNRIAQKNLDDAMIAALRGSLNFILTEGHLVHPLGIEAYNYLLLNKGK